MYVVEKWEHRYEDKYDWDDITSFVSRADGSLVAFDTIEQAAIFCRCIAADRYNQCWHFYHDPDEWDITDFPSSPLINEWYSIGEYYSFKRYLRIVEVRV